MKKFITVLIASILISCTVLAQSTGDYYSVGNGNWNDPTKWQMFNGSSWVAASTYPGQNPGTGVVSITNETEIKITATVPNPISSLYVNADEACNCNNYIAPLGKLIFSAESAISLTVTGGVTIYGELLIDDQNGAKSHSIFIGGSLIIGENGWFDYDYYQLPTVFQTINQDDKLNVTFNTSVPNSIVTGYLLSYLDLSFQDVTFNGIGLSIQAGFLVNGHANFINGKVSGGITFVDGATYSGASAASYVAGLVTKLGNDAFTFPIGNGNVYAPLAISAPSDPGAIVSANYIRSSASNIGPISDPALLNVSNCEYWVLNANNNNLNVTVNWSPSSGCESSPYVTNVSEVTLAYFDNTTQRWNSHGGSGIGTAANGSVTWNGVNMNNSGYFTLGNLNACNAPWGAIATNITTNSATLSWTAVSGAISYDVDYSNSSVWINAATATTNTSVNLSGLSSGSYYQWRIRTNCSSASSLYRQAAFNTLCETPSGLTTSNVTYNSATLNWSPVFNANYNYTAQYKQSNAASWTSVNGYSFTPNEVSSALMGLSPSTGYDWRVVANCPGSQSNYAQASFTTPSQPPCNDVYESNNSFSQAKAIALGNTISASISSSADIDWFKITTPNSANNGLWIMLGNLPADYDLYLYDKRQKLVAASTNTGTANDVVTYNSNARNAAYYIRVIAKNGAFNTLLCYNLSTGVTSNTGSISSTSKPTNEVIEGSTDPLLYPNPASEFVYLNFNSATEGLVNIQIVNSIGQMVKQHPVNTIKGHNQFKIQVADIRPGMYILRINKGDLNLTRKFVIAR